MKEFEVIGPVVGNGEHRLSRGDVETRKHVRRQPKIGEILQQLIKTK